MNGPTVLQTTCAPVNSSVSASTVCSTSTISCSTVSMPGDLADDVLQRSLFAAGGDERDVELAQVLADQPAGVAGGAVDDDGLGAHDAHSPVDGRPMPVMKRAASEARKTTASAMSADLAQPSGRRQPDDGPDACLDAREQAQLGAVDGELHAHRRRHEAGVDAVDADAVAELARLGGGDPGHPVDRRTWWPE